MSEFKCVFSCRRCGLPLVVAGVKSVSGGVYFRHVGKPVGGCRKPKPGFGELKKWRQVHGYDLC